MALTLREIIPKKFLFLVRYIINQHVLLRKQVNVIEKSETSTIERWLNMKWCVFVNRRCCGDDCVGWIDDNCFIFLLLPFKYSYKHQQSEFDWSKYSISNADENDSSRKNDYQLSLLDELEKLITQKNISKNM